MTPPDNEGLAILTEPDRERLLYVIEFSLAIRGPHQFFQWTQGQVQALIPHEIVHCAYGDPGRRDLNIVRLGGTSLPGGRFDRYEELLVDAHEVWHERGKRPLAVGLETNGFELPERLRALVQKLQLGHCAVHGAQGLNGAPGTFFAFLRMPAALTPRRAYLLDLLLPYLHMAFLRALAHHNGHDRRAPAVPSPITNRERQILRWVHEGKSNREIGEVLSISPLTVKNHVQSILKKLHAQNRAQAVGRALSLKII